MTVNWYLLAYFSIIISHSVHTNETVLTSVLVFLTITTLSSLGYEDEEYAPGGRIPMNPFASIVTENNC
eukprot:scaffold86548_cov55-Attheya_sp.AAC.1